MKKLFLICLSLYSLNVYSLEESSDGSLGRTNPVHRVPDTTRAEGPGATSVNYGFIDDGTHRRNLAIAAACGFCVDCISEAKHDYCLRFLCPCGNPLPVMVLDIVLTPLCVIRDCLTVDSTPPRRRKELDAAIHCRSAEGRVGTSVGPECICLRKGCCSCCAGKAGQAATAKHFEDQKRQDANEMAIYKAQQKQLRQIEMK